MTSAQLLSGLRTLLDEAQGGFWTDPECYAALSRGQEEHANIIFAQFKERVAQDPFEQLPEILKVLYTEKTDIAVTNYFGLPEDFLYDLSVYLSDPYNRTFYKRHPGENAFSDKYNSYSYGDFYAITIIGATKNVVVEVETGINYSFKYLKKITAISANIEPILPDFTHNSFIVYAFSDLLKKSKQYDSAALQLKEFLSLIKYI